jgi:hypothetical protein
MWQDILTSILTSSVITGIFVVILNKAIENKFDMKLEAYKDKLKSESDKELMLLTKDLELKASERNIKLTEVITIQVKAIAELYGKILRFRRAGAILLVAGDDEKEIILKKQEAYIEAYFGMKEYYEANRIYIPDKGTKLIDETLGTIWRAQSVSGRLDTHARLGSSKEAVDSLEKLNSELQGKVPKLLEALEAEFKDIIGVNVGKK